MIRISKTFDQNKYIQGFMRDRYKRLVVLLNKHTDADIIEELDKMQNKSQYVKDCIRESLKKHQ